MISHVINALISDENTKKALRTAFCVESLQKLGFHALSLKNSTYRPQSKENNSVSYASKLEKNFMSGNNFVFNNILLGLDSNPFGVSNYKWSIRL